MPTRKAECFPSTARSRRLEFFVGRLLKSENSSWPAAVAIALTAAGILMSWTRAHEIEIDVNYSATHVELALHKQALAVDLTQMSTSIDLGARFELNLVEATSYTVLEKNRSTQQETNATQVAINALTTEISSAEVSIGTPPMLSDADLDALVAQLLPAET